MREKASNANKKQQSNENKERKNRNEDEKNNSQKEAEEAVTSGRGGRLKIKKN